jgi:hypothetical protein
MGKKSKRSPELSASEDEDDVMPMQEVVEKVKKKKKKDKTKERAEVSNTTTTTTTTTTGLDIMTTDDLDQADEAWIIKVPTHFNIGKLSDEIINLDSDAMSIIQVNDVKYAAKVTKKKSNLPFLIANQEGKMKPVSVHCRGEVNLSEFVQLPELPKPTQEVITVVPQPTNLKRRHPFFGLGTVILTCDVKEPGRVYILLC